MINVTPAAAEQIRNSAQQGNMEGLPLRIAAQRQTDGTIHYGMGFDDSQVEGDTRVSSEGIELVVAPTSTDLLRGAVIDYVELEPGKFEFIFMNPNDPNHTPPEDGKG
jgi:iron-sulfur cluster assembly protein